MATISIADNDARKQYTQAVTANSTQLTIDFPFFSLDDINVIVTNTSGVDTTLTRGTGTGTFAVTGVSVDDGFSGGHITLGDTYGSGTKFTIFRDITVERTTDFPTSGPFNVSALNTELDKIFAIEQELETKIGRTMKLADSDTAASLTLPNLDTRKGTTLAFNATSGLPEAGPSIASVGTVSTNVANINTVAAAVTNINLVAGQISPTNNLSTVASAATNINLVGGSISNVNTVAANITAIGAAADNATKAQNYATKIDGAIPSTSDFSAKAQAVGGTGVTSVTGSAREWAIGGGSSPNATTAVDSGGEFSAKGYAVGSLNRGSAGAHSAKDWATYTSGTVDGSLYSAKYYAEQAAASFDSLDDKYLGSKSSDPTVDNDGNTLIDGALYYDTSNNKLKVYDLGNTQWIAIEAGATAGFAIAMAIAL